MKLGKVGILVAARTSSTRLPGKALLPLQGLPMLTFLLRRLQGLQSGVVILATTDLPVDDELATIAAREGIGTFRGSESDLVARYVGAAKHFGLDAVARVTADCPFVDAELVDWCVMKTEEFDRFDLATTKGRFPVGLDVEIYRAETMVMLDAKAPLSRDHREHLTLYFYDHRDSFAVQSIAPPPGWRPASRSFTVDTASDYSFARSLADQFDRANFGISALLAAASSSDFADRSVRA
ncbi:cytidylyltransferase domain-containing protein [Bradyrhizobium sp.]|uniref:cytidylyltransferase domain-containing protein n=1 Tax=Bradyrhizobium sp. TaxID=376 RepID=UPI002D486A72|nr:NTP transferase domain-containing protein [Bradyrhizobium sp.]HZR76029.1 NTP transferase domain-containing protein [Bradyrhizobium sp.]